MSAKSHVNIIDVKGLSLSYGAEEILHGISFAIKKGQIVAVIGPNGSGKTSLIKAVIGILPYDGTVKILGQHVSEILSDIGYLPQQFSFDRSFPITVQEFLKLSLLTGQAEHAITEKLAEVGMVEQIDQLLGNLSGGQLQRVLIARALLNNPRILILDEPATGVDIGAERNFYQLIRHLNKTHDITVIFVSHELDLVYDFADQVICLNKNLVCMGIPRKVLTADKLEELYGGGLSHHHHHGHAPIVEQVNHALRSGLLKGKHHKTKK